MSENISRNPGGIFPDQKLEYQPIENPNLIYNVMSDSTRAVVTENAVVETITENKYIQSYFKNNLNDGKPVTVREVLESIDSNGICSTEAHNDPDMQILKNSDILDYKILDFEYSEGAGSKAFIASEDNSKVYCAFAGTGKNEGVDNGELMFKESTTQQADAANYFDRMMDEHSDFIVEGKTEVNVTGHSKGGNKAMYVTMQSKYADYITHCVALDGPGFSPAANERWSQDEYTFGPRREKIISVNGSDDFVHCTGVQIRLPENTYYIDTNSLSEGFVGKHLHEGLFKLDKDQNYTAELGKEWYTGPLPTFISSFMEQYLNLPPEVVEQTAPGLMSFIWSGQSFDGMSYGKFSTICLTALTLYVLANPDISGRMQIVHSIMEHFAGGGYVASKPGKGAIKEASDNPDFYINYVLLGNVAAQYNGIGGTVAAIQDKLGSMSYNVPDVSNAIGRYNLLRSNPLFKECYGSSSLSDLVTDYNPRREYIRSEESKAKKCKSILEDVKCTLNKAVDYCRDTSNDFITADQWIKDLFDASFGANGLVCRKNKLK